MEIHELNTFSGTLGSGDYFATDNGNDTSKVSAEAMFAPLNARIDNIIASPAPSAEEIVDARLGADGVTYTSLGDAIRGQVGDLKSELNLLADGLENVKFDVILNKGFNRTDGTFPDEANWDITDFIPVVGGESIWVDNPIYKSDYNGWYTEDKTYINWFSVPAGTNIEIGVPKNAAYVVLTNSHARFAYKVRQNVQTLATKDDVSVVATNLDNFKDDISTLVASKNRYDNTYTSGKYVNNTSGELVDNASYCTSDYIDVSAYNSIVFSSHDQNISLRFALYINKSVSGYVDGASVSLTYDATTARYYYVIDTSSANYIRFSASSSEFQYLDISQLMIESGSTPSLYAEYFADYYTLDTGAIKQLESAVLGKPLNTVSGAMTNGTKLQVESNSIRKSNQIVFFGKFSAFDTLYVGHGESGSNTEFVAIDDTNIYFATNGTVPDTGVAHGLTINTYLGVVIDIADNCIATVTLYTLGGTYTRTLPSTSPWVGCSGEIFAKSVNSTFTEAHLTWNADYQKNKWFFGDSYMTNYSDNRWTYYMQQMGFDNALINAFPGQGSASAYLNWQTALGHGKPKYALWALGMNDADSGAINSDWKTAVDAFIADCETFDITPILATIPNTPIETHTYKNAYVKSLGYRYIDFAEAVGASSTNATWYSGCLSNDNVHPTEYGARMLFMQALIDFPEIMQN